MSDSQIWSILQTLSQVGNMARVIILTASDDKRQLIRALRMGCAGIILKRATADEIGSCIRTVYTGGVWLDPRIAAVLGEFHPRTNDENATSATRSGNQVTLNKREREVLGLIAHGYANPEIAAKLFISGHTVKNHVHHLYQKTGSANRADLVIFAIHNGFDVINVSVSHP
jgi:DNA-binding NarL/FixJ family response regulator